jgi:hypothetical protein
MLNMSTGILGCSAHLFEHIKAPKSRQIDIEDDQVPALATHEIKRLPGVPGRSEYSPLEFVVQYSPEALVNHQVIVNY